MSLYYVTIPYRVSKHGSKCFNITYDVEAGSKKEALELAKERFNQYHSSRLAAWERTMFEEDITVSKAGPGSQAASEAITELCSELDSSSPPRRAAALERLRGLENEQAVPTLIRMLFSLEDQKIDVIETLAACGSSRTAKELETIYASEESTPEVKASLVKLIGQLGGSKSLGFLEMALSDRDPRVRANTVEALEEIGGDDVFQLVLSAIHDEDNRVRANSIRAIYRMKGLFLDDALREMLHHSDPKMRISAAFAAGEMSIPEVLADLKQSLNDPDSRVKHHAARALGKVKEPESLSVLIEAMDDFCRQEDESLLIAAREALLDHPARAELSPRILQALGASTGTYRDCLEDLWTEFLRQEKKRGKLHLGLRFKRWFV